MSWTAAIRTTLCISAVRVTLERRGGGFEMRDQAQYQASYLRQASRAFMERTGLHLTDVRPDVERLPAPIRISRAMHLDTPPDAYARVVAERCGFVGLDEHDADIRNRSVAEMLSHVASNPEWSLGRDGAAYCRDGGDIVRIKPHVGGEADTSFGYDVARSSTGSLGIDKGAVQPLDAKFVTQSRGVELEEAFAPTANAPGLAA